MAHRRSGPEEGDSRLRIPSRKLGASRSGQDCHGAGRLAQPNRSLTQRARKVDRSALDPALLFDGRQPIADDAGTPVNRHRGRKSAMPDAELDQLAINTIRTLSIDAVQAASSGHPGTPMALAPLVYTLWNRVMRFDPQDPIWPGRDRFVLSNGHASMLL